MAGLLVVVVVAAMAFGASRIPHICLVEELLGVHCPGCGLTRAMELLVFGNWMEAMQVNILALPLVVFILVRTIVVRPSRFDVVIASFEPCLLGLAAVQFLLANNWL